MQSRWREEAVNTNKANGFGLGGSYCTVFVMLLSVKSFEAPGYENLGQYVKKKKIEVMKLLLLCW